MITVRLMGVVLGTADGWDGGGDTSYMLYDFKSELLDNGDCIGVDWEQGILEYYNDEGEVYHKVELLDILYAESTKNK